MSNTMKTWSSILVLAACAGLAGCVSTRSISNSDYREPGTGSHTAPAGHSDPAFAYRGELSEFDLLGVVGVRSDWEEEIKKAWVKARRIRLKRTSTILLFKSGPLFLV